MQKTKLATLLAVAGGLSVATAACSAPADDAGTDADATSLSACCAAEEVADAACEAAEEVACAAEGCCAAACCAASCCAAACCAAAE